MKEKKDADISGRIQNLLWTVSGDYELDIKVDEDIYRKSRPMAFYYAIRQGTFEKYFETPSILITVSFSIFF